MNRRPLSRWGAFGLLILLAWLANPAATAESTTPTLTRGPYLQKAGPAAVTVRWRTDVEAIGRVSWGVQPGEARGQLEELTSTTEHELRLTGLDPGTTYYYKVEAGNEPLAGGDAQTFFTTPPPADADPYARVWVLGDSGTGSEGPAPAANAAAVRNGFHTYMGARKADLMIMLGDNARPYGTDEQHQQAIFEMYPDTLRNTPLWPTLGNHDAYSTIPNTNIHPYYEIFSLPSAGECGGEPSGSEAYYSFDYGLAHFICLDSVETNRSTTGTMLSWLARDLAASTRARWTIAFFHNPPYSRGAHNSDLASEPEMIQMRENALPILEAAGVDLVLCGHSHSYERSFLLDGHYGYSWTLQPSMILNGGDGRAGGNGPYLKPAAGRVPHGGTVYAVVGNSGLLNFSGTMDHPVMAKSMVVLGSMVLDLTPLRLEARMIDVKGAVLDEFTIWKAEPAAAAGGWTGYR